MFDQQGLSSFLKFGGPLDDAYKVFVNELGKNDFGVDVNDLYNTKIKFNTKDKERFLTESKLVSGLKRLKPTFNKAPKCNANKMIDGIYGAHKNKDEDVFEGLVNELDDICKRIIRHYEDNSDFYENNHYEKDVYGAACETEHLIKKWKTKTLGTFDEGTKTITLYLLNICDSNDPNVCVLDTYAHELFHAFHFYAASNSFLTAWLDRDVDKFVKEGMARYMEIKYLQNINEQSYAGELINSSSNLDLKNDPYAVCKLYIGNQSLLIEIFALSLEDIGDAYNQLLMGFLNIRNERQRLNKIVNKAMGRLNN